MIVGLTGGIGSGKSTIASMFKELNIPVYIADIRAKELMVDDAALVRQIKYVLGHEAYEGKALNRMFIADKIFSDDALRQQLNALVHPVVASDFNQWEQRQEAPYVLKEAAILFENGGYKASDFNILVTAPREVRIARVIKRDNTTAAAVTQRMKAQWDDTQKAALADVVIENVTLLKTRSQVSKIHQHLLKRVRQNW